MAETNPINVRILLLPEARWWLLRKNIRQFTFALPCLLSQLFARLDRSSTEKCRHSLCWNEIISNSRRNNARTFVHSDRFRKLRCRFALYTTTAIKSIALPYFIALHFFGSLLSLLFVILAMLSVKKSLRPFSESEFYLFTIIVHNFVLCFYYGIVPVFLGPVTEESRGSRKGRKNEKIVHFVLHTFHIPCSGIS